jgi:hypothetical protein
MNFDRRTLLKTTGTLTVLSIAGCLSSPSEKLGEAEITKENNTITLTQNFSSTADDVQVRLKYRSMMTGETGVINSFSTDELTKSNNKYQKNISKETIFEEIPEDEPVELFTESQVKEYTTQSEPLKTDSYLGSTYHMLKFESESMNYTDTDKLINSQNDDGSFDINKIHTLESDDTIQYKIVFFINESRLKSYTKEGEQSKRTGFLPFFFDLEVPKNEKEVLQEVAESGQITWQDFDKEIFTEIGDMTYYERDIFKDFANQITAQVNQQKLSTFRDISDLKILLHIYDKLIDYDYGTIREDDSVHLKYFSQILYDKSSICQGTTFSIASVMHHLGYDVGMQLVVNTELHEYPNGFHIEPTVNVKTDKLEYLRDEYPRQYSEPDRILNDIPEDEVEDHAVAYPGKTIGENWDTRVDRYEKERVPVTLVQMEYLEADS